MILNKEFYVSQMTCSNLCNELPNKQITKTHGESLMEKWCQMGYFYYCQNEYRYYFGPKFVTEFSSYVRDNFADFITKCCLCKEIIFSVSNIINLYNRKSS